jgi:hypothetical protein
MKSNSMPEESTLSVDIIAVLLSHDLADSEAEADCLATSLLDDIESSGRDPSVVCVELFQELFSLSEKQAKEILTKVFPELIQQNQEQEPNSSSESETEEDWLEQGEEVDGEVIGDGECELCERDIKLTKHHLIPCSTWPRIFPRLMNAAEALKSQGSHRAQLILGQGLEHLEPSLRNASKTSMRRILQRTCLICRPCHSTIHRTHDNLTLARDYSTVELLLGDETIYKFCKWASKQKAGKYAVMNPS